MRACVRAVGPCVGGGGSVCECVCGGGGLCVCVRRVFVGGSVCGGEGWGLFVCVITPNVLNVSVA